MSSKRKILFGIYILIVIALITLFVDKILASGSVSSSGTTTHSTSWGSYEVTTEGEVTYSEGGYTGPKNGGVSSLGAAQSMATSGIDYTMLNDNGWIFCIEHGNPLPTKAKEDNIYELAKDDSSTINSRFHNAAEAGSIFGSQKNSKSLTEQEKKALEDSSSVGQGIKHNTTKEYKGFQNSGKEYWARRLDPSSAKVTEVSTDAGTMGWAEGYILANCDPSSSDEKNEAQKALWKALNFNPSEDSALPESDLYKRAKAFEKYKKNGTKEPKLNNPSSTDYKYKFVRSGNYLIAGPINIEYGELEVKYNGTKLEVGKIENLIVKGKDRNGNIVDIEKYEFTDKSGNALTDTVTTKDGKKFPKTGVDFYIKLDYNDPIYTNICEIVSMEVDFYQLDLSASAYKVENVKVIYTEWKPNHIVYTKCIKQHRWTETTADPGTGGTGGTGGSGGAGGGGGAATIPGTFLPYPMHSGDFPCGGMWYCPHAGGGYFADFSTSLKATTTKTETENCTSHMKTTDAHNNCTKAHSGCSVSQTGHSTIDESLTKSILIKQKDSLPDDAQKLWLLHEAKMYWRKYKLVILFGPDTSTSSPPAGTTTSAPVTTTTTAPVTTTTTAPVTTTTTAPVTTTTTAPVTTTTSCVTTPPSSETPHRTYIDIGGKVWVDQPDETKEKNTANGIYDDGLESGHLKENVKVTLYFDDTNQPVTREDTAPGGRFKENPTYTDSNGSYMFYDLPMNRQYYVEFTYDGMIYQDTKYLAPDGSLSNYQKNPDSYEKASKAKEDESERTAFNEKFKEISGDTPMNVGSESTVGKSSGGVRLNYKSKKFDGLNIASRLITTDNKSDVDLDIDQEAKGKAESDYEMKATTEARYLLEDESVIYSVENGTKELEYLKHIDLGLYKRQRPDFALSVQLKSSGISIKDLDKVYSYKSSAKEYQFDASDKVDEYIKQEISVADYNWKYDSTEYYPSGTPKDLGYLVVEDELDIYVLYKITVTNQAAKVSGKITEIIDYYDKSLIFDNSYTDEIIRLFGKKYPGISGPSWVEGSIGSPIIWTQTSDNNGYKAMTTDALKDIDLKSGEKKEICVIFKVDKDPSTRDLFINSKTSSDDGIRNIAEISKYSTDDGVVDQDSAPRNAIPGKKETYEDDTDDAPFFKLTLTWEGRHVQGTVWNDANENGTIDGGEEGVEKVTIRLFEEFYDIDGNYKGEVERPPLKVDGKTIKTDNETIRTGSDGKYDMVVEGGHYRVEFIYGDTNMLFGTYANKKYNAQDYRATKPYKNILDYYKEANEKAKRYDLDVNVTATTGETDENRNDSTASENKTSNGRDNAEIRKKVIESAMYLTNNDATKLHELNATAQGEAVSTKAIAEFLSGDNNSKTKNYTYMEADSEEVVIGVDDLVKDAKIINLGLKERPKTSIELEKKVARIVLKTNDGNTIIDSADKTKVSGLAQDPVTGIQNSFMYLDSLIMENATIDIDYEITVKNTGEADKLINYVTDETRTEDKDTIASVGDTVDGVKYDLNEELPIRADAIYDYVNINLEYRLDNNGGETGPWTKIYDEDDAAKKNKPSDWTTWLTKEVTDAIPKSQKQVSKVLQTNGDKSQTGNPTTGNLTTAEGKNSVVEKIHLGISLAEQTGAEVDNEMVYRNCAEIVKVYSAAGRRDYDTIPGDYVPYTKVVNAADGLSSQHSTGAFDDDADMTGRTVITQPFGQERIYYIIAIVSATIIIAGIIIIKKKVLKK